MELKQGDVKSQEDWDKRTATSCYSTSLLNFIGTKLKGLEAVQPTADDIKASQDNINKLTDSVDDIPKVTNPKTVTAFLELAAAPTTFPGTIQTDEHAKQYETAVCNNAKRLYDLIAASTSREETMKLLLTRIKTSSKQAEELLVMANSQLGKLEKQLKDLTADYKQLTAEEEELNTKIKKKTEKHKKLIEEVEKLNDETKKLKDDKDALDKDTVAKTAATDAVDAETLALVTRFNEIT